MTVLTFPWPKPPLNANQRLHWAAKAKETRRVRDTTRFLAASIAPAKHITVKLTWVVTDKRRRDIDNIYPTFKAMCDGLVDAQIVMDDIPAMMTKLAPEIRYEKNGKPHLELDIT